MGFRDSPPTSFYFARTYLSPKKSASTQSEWEDKRCPEKNPLEIDERTTRNSCIQSTFVSTERTWEPLTVIMTDVSHDFGKGK